MAVHPSCALSGVSRTSLTRLSTGLRDRFKQGGIVYRQNRLGPSALTQWFQFAGHSLEELIIGEELGHCSIEDLKQMFEALERNCLALRCLHIDSVRDALVRDVLRAARGRLHELTFFGPDISTIEMHGPGLRKLTLDNRLMSWKTPESITGVLSVAGPTLESIWFSERLTIREMKKVRELCPKLTSISMTGLRDNEDDWSAYVDLLCSYGSQLRFSEIKYWDTCTVFMGRVGTSCPNMRCQLTACKTMFGCSEHIPGKMKALGRCLKKVRFRVVDVEDVPSMEDLASAARSCSQLEFIDLCFAPEFVESTMTAMFCCDMPMLKAVTLRI